MEEASIELSASFSVDQKEKEKEQRRNFFSYQFSVGFLCQKKKNIFLTVTKKSNWNQFDDTGKWKQKVLHGAQADENNPI